MTETRRWLNIPFSLVEPLEPQRDAQGRPVGFSPADRYANRNNLAVHRWGRGPFCKFKVGSGIYETGVYVLTADGVAKYVGMCQSLGARWGAAGYGSIQPRNCFEGGQRTNCKINHLALVAVKAGHLLQLWFRPDRDRVATEARLIAALDPPWNGRF